MRASEERRTTARGLQKSASQGSTSWIAFTFCPNLSNCQSECEVCCSDVNVALLEQCCNYSKQCRNNVATLCCAKNRRCESCTITLISKITTLYVHQAFLYIFLPFLRDYDVKIPNFVFYGERKQAMTKWYFAFWTRIWSLGIQIQEGSRTFDQVSK